MGYNHLSCPLCSSGKFSSLQSLLDSLVHLLSGPLTCSVPGCSWQLMGAQQLIHHVAFVHSSQPKLDSITKLNHSKFENKFYNTDNNPLLVESAPSVNGKELQFQIPPRGDAEIINYDFNTDADCKLENMKNDEAKKEEINVEDLKEFFYLTRDETNRPFPDDSATPVALSPAATTINQQQQLQHQLQQQPQDEHQHQQTQLQQQLKKKHQGQAHQQQNHEKPHQQEQQYQQQHQQEQQYQQQHQQEQQYQQQHQLPQQSHQEHPQCPASLFSPDLPGDEGWSRGSGGKGIQAAGMPKHNLARQSSAESQQVACKDCGWMFDNISFLKLHKILMHNLRPQCRRPDLPKEYICTQCTHQGEPQIFGTCEAYEEHMAQVHKDDRHICSFCTKAFKLKGSLLVHQRVIHQANNLSPLFRSEMVSVNQEETGFLADLPTSSSPEIFDNKAEEAAGVGTHSDEPRTLINTQFIDFSLLEKGEVLEDLDRYEELYEGRKELVCNMCTRIFTDIPLFQAHVRSHQESKKWDCNFCGKKFTTKYFLKKHRRLHTGETPYSCELCGKSFAFQQSYHKHMLYHTDEKPYSCTTCGRPFKELSTLQNHERIHSGERPFVCETCGKSFRQRVSYLVHRRIHTGVMPYICHHCGKKFRYKVTQRTHKCPGRGEGGSSGAEEHPQAESLFTTATTPCNSGPNSPLAVGFGLSGIFPPDTRTVETVHFSPIQSSTGQLGDVQTAVFPPNTGSGPSAISGAFSLPRESAPVSPHKGLLSAAVPAEIRQHLLKFRRAQGRRHLGHRLQHILERSRGKYSTSGELPLVQPVAELQFLSIADTPGTDSTGSLGSNPDKKPDHSLSMDMFCPNRPEEQEEKLEELLAAKVSGDEDMKLSIDDFDMSVLDGNLLGV